MNSIGFIGGGRVTRIIVGGWKRAEVTPPRLLVHEPDDSAFAQLAVIGNAITRASLQDAAAAHVVFVALHPPMIADTLAVAKPFIRKDAVLVSLAPKLTIAQLTGCSGTEQIARVIPNAPSVIGQGYNPIALGPALDDLARATVIRLFRPLGDVPEVVESRLEAYTILSAMGPTYFWFQWQALREIAVTLGLPHDDADDALRGMLMGSLATLLDSGLSPAAVMDLVPVKPIGTHEAAIVRMYEETLTALHAKIAPAREHGAHAS